MTRHANQTSFQKGHKKLGGFVVGSRHTEEAKEKVSASLRGKTGKEARRWKGTQAGYVAIHTWIVKHYGKATRCENKDCIYPRRVNIGREVRISPRRYEWANISKEYKREREDYLQLCPSCHRKWDMGKITINI